MHGIYTQLDRNALQDRAWADLFMQFRKWMRPTWVRYFGRRFLKPMFNESLGQWEVPVYKPEYDIATFGYKMFKQESDIVKLNLIKDPKNYFKGLYSMFNYQLKVLRHLKFYYNTLPKAEQAAMLKWVNMSTIAVVGTAALFLGKLHDEDEEETYAYNAMMFTISALYKEIVEPIPLYGWGSTVSQIKDSTFAGEKMIDNAMKLVKYTMADIFTDNESHITKHLQMYILFISR